MYYILIASLINIMSDIVVCLLVYIYNSLFIYIKLVLHKISYLLITLLHKS